MGCRRAVGGNAQLTFRAVPRRCLGRTDGAAGRRPDGMRALISGIARGGAGAGSGSAQGAEQWRSDALLFGAARAQAGPTGSAARAVWNARGRSATSACSARAARGGERELNRLLSFPGTRLPTLAPVVPGLGRSCAPSRACDKGYPHPVPLSRLRQRGSEVPPCMRAWRTTTENGAARKFLATRR